MSPEQYQVPPLLFVICAMSAMAFAVASYRWLWCVLRDPDSVRVGFVDAIKKGQKQALICSMFLSIGVGVYDFVVAQLPLRLIGEFVFLLIVGIMAFMRLKTIQAVLSSLKHALVFGCLCLIGWAILIAMGLLISFVLKLIPTVTSAEYDVMVVFTTGLLLNAPILWLGYKILDNPKAQPLLKGKSPHTFLWPIMLAYLVLLVPLMVQDTISSKDWQDRGRVTKIRQI